MDQMALLEGIRLQLAANRQRAGVDDRLLTKREGRSQDAALHQV